MNYREKIRKAIECPQFNNTRYGEWGALNLEQRKYIKRLLDELDSADNYIKNLYLEHQKLKENYDRIYNENCILREKHNINDIGLLDENYRLKQAIDKTIEYINHFSKESEVKIYGLPKCKVFIGDIEQLLEILKGDSNE